MPLLCLAGLTRSSLDFHGLALEESARRRVLCPDYRGRGRSQWDRDLRNYHPGTYIRDILDLLSAFDVARVAVLGTSLGGLLAMALCAARPTAIAGGVLNDIGPEIEARGIGAILDCLARLRPQPDWAAAARHLSEVFYDRSPRDDETWLELARSTFREAPNGRIVVNWDPDLIRPLRTGTPLPDLWALFRAFGARPVLVIRGANSAVLSEATLQRMAREKPDIGRLIVPGIGHAPSLNEPQARRTIAAHLHLIDARENAA